MGQVLIRRGDILEGSADLTVFPCSAKGTTSSSMKRWQDLYGVPSPPELKLTMQHGSLSSEFPFPGPKLITKWYCYAAAVLNDFSSAGIIEQIGKQIGDTTRKRTEIRVVEAPLLGSGAGGLETLVAGRSLAKGFLASSSADSLLYIFVYDEERYAKLAAALRKRRWLRRLWDAILLRPGWHGISLDVKELLGR